MGTLLYKDKDIECHSIGCFEVIKITNGECYSSHISDNDFQIDDRKSLFNISEEQFKNATTVLPDDKWHNTRTLPIHKMFILLGEKANRKPEEFQKILDYIKAFAEENNEKQYFTNCLISMANAEQNEQRRKNLAEERKYHG